MTVTVEGARRLVALTRVDIVGSSAALAADGVTAAVADRRQLTDMVGRAAEAAGGWVVATEGDAAVVACPSTIGSLAVAADLIAGARSGRFDVRVGVTVGELEVDQAGGLRAPDPSLAARLDRIERAAGPGEATIDGSISRVLTGSAGIRTEAVAGTDESLRRVTGFRLADDGAIPTELRAVMFSRYSVTASDSDPESADRSSAEPDANDGDDLDVIIGEAAGLISAGHGTIVDDNGPGHVAVFAGGREALVAAEAIHALVASANLRAGARGSVTASLSIAVGEVSVGEGDTYGPPVVEAARLLGHAGGGTSLTADTALIVGLGHPDLETLGPIPLKGFEEAPIVHRLAPGPPPALVDLPPALRRSGRFAFAGRADELAALRATWDAVRDGAVRGVVISGEEGVGKTRLTRELVVEAAEAGAIVLFGAADEELEIPYAAVAQALSAAAPIDATVAAALDVDRGAGSTVGPEAGEATADDRPANRAEVLRPLFAAAKATVVGGAGLEAGESAVDRHGLFAEVGACLGRLSHQRPVMVVIDDLQWVGPDSIELVDHLLADPAAQRLMVMATVRSEHLGPTSPIHRLLGSSRNARRLTHRRLGRLDAADVAAMLSSRTEAPLEGRELEFVAEVTRATGGSPLFVEELMVHLAATGVLQQRDGGWDLAVATDQIPIPETVLDLMVHRLARLGPGAASVLPVAAVVGSSFTVDVVAGVVDEPLETIVDVVDGGVDIGLLHEDGPAGTFSFADEITREAALRPLRSARRALIHRGVAEYLEGQQPQPIDALVYHWGAAIGRDAVEHSIRYQRMAAARDIAAAAWESAIERLRRITVHLDSLGVDDDRARAEVHYDLGFSLRMIGDDSHLPDLTAAADLARSLGDGRLLARAAMAMMRPGAWYPEAAVVDDQITEMYQDALYLLEPEDPTRPRVLAALATNLAYDPDTERRWMLLREAQQAAEELGDRQLVAVTAAAELIACQEPDLFERRWTLACEVRRAGQALGDRDLAFTGGFFMMLEHIGRGEIDKAERLHPELRRLAEAGRAYWPRFLVAHFDSLVAVARCEPGALDVVEAERVAFEDQPVDWFGVSVIQQAVVAMGRGTLADMLLPFAEVQAQYSDNDEWSRKWNYAVAKAYLDSGRLQEAAEVLEQAPELDFDRYWLSSMLHLGQVGLTLERPDLCHRVLDEVMAYRGRFAFVGVGAAITGQVSTALGQAALGLGQLAQAEELFREAVDQAAEVGFPFFETIARRHLAMTLARRDPAGTEAVEHLVAAAATANRYGFVLEVTALESLRADLGH